MIRHIGTIGKLNLHANKELTKLFISKGIEWCEIDIPHKCTSSLAVFFCHRHKRNWYKGKPKELLWSFNQVVLGCYEGHNLIEYNKEKTAEVFERLRGEEII